MLYEDAKKVVERIALTGECDNICTVCPLFTLCETFPNMCKHRVANAWLGRDRGGDK